MSILGVYCWGNSCWNIKSIYYGRSDRACVNFGRFHTPGFMSSQSQIIQIIVPWVIGFSRRWDDEWVLSSTGWNIMALHEIVWHFSFQSEKVTWYCIKLCGIILSFQSEAPSGMVWYCMKLCDIILSNLKHHLCHFPPEINHRNATEIFSRIKPVLKTSGSGPFWKCYNHHHYHHHHHHHRHRRHHHHHQVGPVHSGSVTSHPNLSIYRHCVDFRAPNKKECFLSNHFFKLRNNK